MADHTGIEWTDATWNPIRGCTRVSEGCRNCYAETIAARFSGEGAPYHGFADRTRPGSKWTGRVEVIWHLLDHPFRWTKPRRIFVNSMSDLFHGELHRTYIAEIFATMIAAHHLRGHIFQVLTKRATRMHAILGDEAFWDQVNSMASAHVMERTDPLNRRSDDARATLERYDPDNPPPGIWLGVSVENQQTAEERIPHLLATPATIRFLSCEPLLGPVNLARWGTIHTAPLPGGTGTSSWHTLPGLHWIIAGGESGPGARPSNPQWFRDLRDQASACLIPFFFKQWGEWVSVSEVAGPGEPFTFPDHRSVRRVGKRLAGNTLDGIRHLEFPA